MSTEPPENQPLAPSPFSPEELERNEANRRELYDLVCSGKAVLVVGAGSSNMAGYCLWSELLEKLEQLALHCGGGFMPDSNQRAANQLAYAESVREHIERTTGKRDRYHDLISREFGERNPQCRDFHRVLVQLPFRGILTTNYDKVLEAALVEEHLGHGYDNSLVILEGESDMRRTSEFLLSLDFQEKYSRRIAHLHGIFDQPRSIVLTATDYLRVYGALIPGGDPGFGVTPATWPIHRKLLWAILATRRVVFVGFSMEDQYFVKMLELVSDDLWRWGHTVHFTIMPLGPAKIEDSKLYGEHLKEKYGVCAVFYDNSDGTHRGLESIVQEMQQRCGGERTSRATDWLDQVSEQMEQSVKAHEED